MPTIKLQTGATESDVQAALAMLTSGDTLILPANQTILISKGLKITAAARSITLDLNGSTLQQAGDVSVISVDGRVTTPTSAKLGRDAGGNVTVASAGLAQVKPGDYIKLIADDVLPNDHGHATRLGQAMKVLSVTGSTVTLDGAIVNGELYQTNVRVSHFQSGAVEISNGTVRGDQSNVTWTDALINVRSTVATHIDQMIVRDGNSMGINFINTVGGLVTQSAAINLTDDTANGHYGYGVHSASSVGTTVNGFYAEKVRHAVDDNAVGVAAAHKDASKYGADIGLTATNVVANGTTAFAFSWHSEGRHGHFGDSVVINSHGVVGARGTDHTVRNISGTGNERGIQFLEYGAGDAQRIVIDNMHLKDTQKYAYTNSKNPQNNVISNSTFEVVASYYEMGPDPRVTLIKNVLKIGAAPADETLTGTSGDDRLLGASGIDTIFGGAGRDYIWGGSGADRLTGGAGSDRFVYMNMKEAGDVITDFGGGDVIDLSIMAIQLGWRGDLFENGYVRFVQSGANTLVQVDSNGGGDSFGTLATLINVKASSLSKASISDQIVVTDYAGAPDPAAADVTSGGRSASPFADLASFNKILGTAEGDTLTGSSGADLILGGAGDDKLYGQAGDDVLVGAAGADFFSGGEGTNAVSYADSATGLVVSLSNPSLNTGDAAGDRYAQIKNLTGSGFNDDLYGNDAMNKIEGGAGDDQLFGLDGSDFLFGGWGDDMLDGGRQNDKLDGGMGNDRLFGGEGYDTLTGGAGSDLFIFDVSLKKTLATITDFNGGVDKIGIAASGLGSLVDVHFETGPSIKADTIKPTLLYNDVTGVVSWDIDGSGPMAALSLGMVTPGLHLGLADFVLI
jgi:Ca2+-binding RTX toxin-like protein